MTSTMIESTIDSARPVFQGLRAWREHVMRDGELPVITVVGSRGKTTIVRLLASCLERAGYRVAIRTNHGVEIRGELQQGELLPWSRVEQELRSGSLDVAIREVDWATTATLGLQSSIPFLIVSNICANREECSVTPDARMARKALASLLPSLSPSSIVIFNGEDLEVASGVALTPSQHVLVGKRLDSPRMEEHFSAGGICAWVDERTLTVGSAGTTLRVCRVDHLSFTLGGAAGFEIQNALLAIGAATVLGIRVSAISSALASFKSNPRLMPGSFNIIQTGGALVILDRPAPSWFLRPALRALRDYSKVRLLTVLGPLDDVPEDDLPEIGRRIGHRSSAVLLHDAVSDQPGRIAQLTAGIAKNEVPPLVMTLPSESQAVSLALTMAKPHDVMYVLTDRPLLVARQINLHTRRLKRNAGPSHPRSNPSEALLFRPWNDHHGSTLES